MECTQEIWLLFEPLKLFFSFFQSFISMTRKKKGMRTKEALNCKALLVSSKCKSELIKTLWNITFISFPNWICWLWFDFYLYFSPHHCSLQNHVADDLWRESSSPPGTVGFPHGRLTFIFGANEGSFIVVQKFFFLPSVSCLFTFSFPLSPTFCSCHYIE